MFTALLSNLVGDGMFALVYFPTLRNHAVVELRELSSAVAEGDQVYLDLGAGLRIPIHVVDIGTKDDLLQLKRNHLTASTQPKIETPRPRRGKRRARSDGDNGEAKESTAAAAAVAEEDTPSGSSSSDDTVTCSCTNDTSEFSEMLRLRSEVNQLRADLDTILTTLGLKARLTPTVVIPEDERYTPDDIEYSYLSKTDVVVTARKSRSVTAFARQLARKLFTSGPDKTARMRNKIDKDKVEWLRRICCAYYPTVEWSQQCAQWAACMRAIDNYTVWFQNRSTIGSNTSVLSGLASIRDELAQWNNGIGSVDGDGVKGEPLDVDGDGDSTERAPRSTAGFNISVTVNEQGEIVVPT